jgi:hypothetical protein
MLFALPTTHTPDRYTLGIEAVRGFPVLLGLILLFAPNELVAAPQNTSSIERSSSADLAPIKFNRDIRPILSDACFACHGPDKHSRQADLRLDDRESAMAAGAITPNSPASSSILERIDSHDPDLLMPPAKTGKSITPEQRKALLDNSLVAGVYEKAIDRESAYESLKGAQPNSAANSNGTPPANNSAAPSSNETSDNALLSGLGDVLFGRTGPRGAKQDGLAQAMVKSAVRTIGSSVGREIVRGVLGGILGGRRR